LDLLTGKGRQIARVALLALLILALYGSTFIWLGHEWWTNDYYSHGPLVVLISALLVWRRRRALRRQEPTAWGLAGIGLGLALHLAGLFMRAPFLSSLSFPLLLGGLVGFLLGRPALGRLLFPLAFLWLAVPLPFVEIASFPLQVVTADASTALARLLRIPAEVQGAQVTLATCQLQVGAPCSGLRSIVALLTLVVLFVYIIRGPGPARAALIILAVPIAIAANIVRVTALLVIADRWGREAALRYFHDYSSPVLFVIAFGLLIALSWALRCREIRPDI
jgi:exosortase